jgi:hypothetical protein
MQQRGERRIERSERNRQALDGSHEGMVDQVPSPWQLLLRTLPSSRSQSKRNSRFDFQAPDKTRCEAAIPRRG